MKTLAVVFLALGIGFLRADPPAPNPAQAPSAIPNSAPTTNDWTIQGKTYHNVVVVKVEADRVHITYDGGVGTVNLSDLPTDLQTQLGYDQQKAETATQIRALQAQISELTAQNAELRAALARYKGALTEAKAKPQPSIAGFHCYLYRLTSAVKTEGRHSVGEVAVMTQGQALAYAQDKWAQMSYDQKMAYEKIAQETGDPIAEEDARNKSSPPSYQGSGAPPAPVPLPPLTTTVIDPQTGDVQVIVH